MVFGSCDDREVWYLVDEMMAKYGICRLDDGIIWYLVNGMMG